VNGTAKQVIIRLKRDSFKLVVAMKTRFRNIIISLGGDEFRKIRPLKLLFIGGNQIWVPQNTTTVPKGAEISTGWIR